MKKTKILIGSSLIGLAVACLSTFVVTSLSKPVEAEGYSTSSLPTTIDLNDTSASNIRSYYSSLDNLSTSERQGTNLLKNLKTVLKNGQKYYSYDSGSAIWQIYEIADRDWAKSPASSTTYGTYNSSTNKITGYTYGTSASSSKNNPYIHALYINRSVTNQVTAWDNHNQDEWGINREHVWPKAEGFETSGAGGARGDPMHLMAGNGYANNIHSNYYYGYVKTSSSYTDCGSTYSNQSGNLRGTSKTLNTGTVFEPQDCDKGDIARAIFYMVARYNYLSGSDSDGIDSNNPNLALTQSISDWASSGYSSTTSKTGKMGILTDLLNWHHEDPVDEYEIHRNNLLYTNYTNNRNPFIDFPEWVDFIWGTATYNGTTYQSYSSTPTGYATPSSDTINGYNGGGSTETLTLDHYALNLTVGGSAETLTATVSGGTGSASFVSNNTSVCTVTYSNNVATITPVAEGSTTITVTYGSKTKTCDISVSTSGGGGGGEESQTEDGSVTAANGALEGWTASGTGSAYADGSVKFGGGGVYVQKLDIFTGDVSQYMTSLEVTINGKINGTPTAANSYKVEALDSSGNVLASETKTGADIVTTSYGDTVFTMDSNLAGCTGIRITYVTKGGGNWGIKSVSWVATYDDSGAEEPTVTSISVSGQQTAFTVGDPFVFGGTVTAHLSDSTTADVTEDAEFDGYDGSTSSQQTITVYYLDKSTTYNVTVSEQSSGGEWVISDTPYRKALFASTYNSKSVSGYSNEWTATNSDNATSTSFTVNVVNANNNSNGWNYIKIGHKTTAYIGSITTASYIDKPIGRITVNIGAVNQYCTSLKLYWSTTTTFTAENSDSFTLATGQQSVDLETPTANLYYKVEAECTTGGSSNGHIQINRIDYYDAEQSGSSYTASDWVDEFLSDITCDATGATTPVLKTSWATFKTKYNSLSSSDQNTIKNATSNPSGTDLQKAVHKYDYIIAKYGTATYENFIGRSISPIGMNMSLIKLANNNSITAIVVIVSLVGITSIGVYFSLRKRKEN